MLEMAEYHSRSVVPTKALKRPSIKVRKQKLLTFLQGHFLTLETLKFGEMFHVATSMAA